ncbi:MAG: hypothetical protein IPM40_18935 [Gammaproteobacteria bacterium]|nr:hypothetical protein [Gammaproteobacteria bacterium]
MMRAIRLAEFAHFLGLPAPARDAAFDAVSTDTRTLAPGSLFVALRGENFDGHDFVAEAVRRGAGALLCSRPVDAAVPVLQVADTLVALGELGRFNRSLFTGTVVALTGSAGKTTTKEMIAAILGRAGSVLATAGNLNNEIGVPLTLLALHPALRYAVIEMGAAKPGDIRYLGALVRPDVAVLTNALPAHLQGFGSLQAVAATKGEIYDALGPDGVAVLNVDEPFADAWLARIGARTVLRASARGAVDADVRAEDIKVVEGNARFRPGDRGRCGAHRSRCPRCAAGRQRGLRGRRGAGARSRAGGDPRRARVAHSGVRAHAATPRRARLRADRRQLQRQSRLGARGDRFAGHLRGHARAGVGKHGRARRAEP